MNTGHDGSMGTVHANNPREAISRVENMIAMGGFTLPTKTVREQIAGAVNVIVQAQRLRDGSRKITHISEVVGMEGEVVTLQDIFVYEITGEDANGKLIGQPQIQRPAAEILRARPLFRQGARPRRRARSGRAAAAAGAAPGRGAPMSPTAIAIAASCSRCRACWATSSSRTPARAPASRCALAAIAGDAKDGPGVKKGAQAKGRSRARDRSRASSRRPAAATGRAAASSCA